MSYTTSRLSAMRQALVLTLGRPLRFVLLAGPTAMVLGALMLASVSLWRLQPLEVPQWLRPQALVLVAGAEGEIDLGSMQTALRQSPLVAAAEFLGRDAALAELARRKALSAIGLNELHPNPLPDAFVIRFEAGSAPDAVEAAVAALRKLKSVDGVEYQGAAYRKLFVLSQLAGRLAALIGASLLACMFIGVALAATFWTRVDQGEIRVLHMLGADASAMRRPYVYAGALSLVIAMALGWWMAATALAWLEPLIGEMARQYSIHWAPNPVPGWLGAAICAGAAIPGAALGSVVARWSMARSEL